MSILEEVLTAVATAVKDADPALDPDQALVIATLDVVHAIIGGHGVTTMERLATAAEIVCTDADLQRQTSQLRHRIFSQALVEHRRPDSHDFSPVADDGMVADDPSRRRPRPPVQGPAPHGV